MPARQAILVATDLSARCDRAMERALLLAREERKSLIVLHVHEGETRLSADEESRMRTLICLEFGLGDDDADIVFEHGSVPEMIAKVASDRDCALIVTGVARFNSPSDFVLGTAVDYVVRKSAAPVLVVKRRANRPYARLLMPVDFSAADTQALLEASRLFEEAQFRLVHAYEAAFEAFLEHDSTANLIRDESRESMDQLVTRLPESLQSRLDTEVVEGSLHPVIVQQIDAFRADLLVLGSDAPRGGYTHVATSDDNWRAPATSPCDLLVVKSARGGS